MKKRDIIRIINEEVNLALDEQEKQLYKVVDADDKKIYPISDDLEGLNKKLATQLAAKHNKITKELDKKWSVKKINEMYDPIYNSNLPEIVASLIASGITIKQIIKFILKQYKNKKNGDKLDKDTIVEIINKAKKKSKTNIKEMKATVKGKDITKLLNDYLGDLIDKKEFQEKLTDLKKKSINEAKKPYTIVVYNGKRLAVDNEDIPRLKSGKDVVGKNLKYAGQEEWILAKGKWKIEESINENLDDSFGLGISPHFSKIHKATLKKFNVKSLKEIPKDRQEEVLTYIDKLASKYYVNENEGMSKSLKDIDPNLSLTKFNTTPPSFKITYMKNEDMSKEMEEELVAWVLSKGGVVDEVNNNKKYTVQYWKYTRDDDYDLFNKTVDAASEEEAIEEVEKLDRLGKSFKAIKTHYPYVKFSYK